LSTTEWLLLMNILIAEDETDIALLYKIALERRNHQVITTENGENCLKAYHEKCQYIRTAIDAIGQTLPFDVVILDHKMPMINGMQVAEEILAMNPHQRIIFASAYVKETLTDSIRKLKQVVELMQKPFNLNTLIDTVEDKEIYYELERFKVDLDIIRSINPTHEQIIDLLKRLRTIQKGRTF
jgi:DNA-binding NtrC family response regulator